MKAARSGKTDLSLPPVSVNGLLFRIFRAEARFMPSAGWPFGLSVICVGEKE